MRKEKHGNGDTEYLQQTRKWTQFRKGKNMLTCRGQQKLTKQKHKEYKRQESILELKCNIKYSNMFIN